MTSVSKILYIHKLDDQQNNRHHRTMIAKLIDVQCSTYVNFAVENNDIDPKSEVANRVRISKYKKVLQQAIILVGLKKLL